MLPEDAFRLHISRLVHGEAASGRELEALVRAPNSPAILLHLVRATWKRQRPPHWRKHRHLRSCCSAVSSYRRRFVGRPHPSVTGVRLRCCRW